MELFQQVQLESKLEELLFSGKTLVTWQQMYCWYDVEKITKAPWRDIQSRWDVLCERYHIETSLPLTVRGIKGGFGGVHFHRPFVERFDGSEDALENLV